MSDDEPVGLFTVNVTEGALQSPSVLVHTTPNLPFQAEQFEEHFCTAEDGTTRRIIVRSKIYRDQAGRRRAEWTPPGKDMGHGFMLCPSFVALHDPIGEVFAIMMNPPGMVIR